MASKNGSVWPIKCAIKLKIIRHATTLISQVLQTDKTSSNVKSIINIPYTSNKKDGWLRFDWHFPVGRIKKEKKLATPTIFYYHGGGWSSADKSLYTKFCKDLVERGFCVVNVNYRLMPEYDLETALSDCLKCTNYVLQNKDKYGVDSNKIFMAGDSAGAHISALLAGQKQQNLFELPCTIKGLGLYYGVYSFFNLKSSEMKLLHTYHEMFKVSKKKKLEEFYYLYSPSSYVDENFPPCFVTSGEVDKLHNESKEFVKLLNENNVKTKVLFFPKERKDARHAFLNLNTLAAQEAFLELVNFFKQQLKNKKIISSF